MQRQGRTAPIVVLVLALVLIGGAAAALWWWSAAQRDTAEQQIVTDADAVVASYYVAHPHPKLGNWERMTGAGFDHTSYGENKAPALRAARTAHFTNSETSAKATLEVILLIVPPRAGEDTGKTAIRSVDEEGREFVLTDPRYKG